MRDEYYKGLCANPNAYDKVIDLIMEKNKRGRSGQTMEEFATECLHYCIRTAVYGDSPLGNFISTGMALAITVERPEGRRAYIAFEP